MAEERPAWAPAAVNLLLVLADNKYWLGRHLSEWAVGSPSLEVGVACAAVAQGELGQARVLYPLLEELAFPGPVDPTERRRTYNVTMLDRPFPTWPHAVAALLLVDTAVTTMLEALRDGPYQALARRVPRMLEEEAFHWDFAEGRVYELVRLPGGREQLQARVDESLAELLCWFGQPGERGVETLRGGGLLSRGNQELRRAYLDRVGPPLRQAGIRLPAGDDRQLPWRRWNPLQRRLEICPWCGSDQVEQVGMVGATVMTSQWICNACHSPFQRIRSRGRGDADDPRGA
ncbi:MAG TPA: Phenylacetic acid catabolic protein [Actinomycetota bacterium]|nr:Phenylacetic acid catabolic protein [Actinomycetota bacterium]